MKKFILLLTVCVVTVSSDLLAYRNLCCNYNDEFYAEIFGGANFIQTTNNGPVKPTYKTGYIIAGTLGTKWCYGFRTEFEYAYRRNEVDKLHYFWSTYDVNGHFQSSSLMGNLIWDVPFERWGCYLFDIQPFVGAGIGYDYQKVKASQERVTLTQISKHFAWQVIAGVSYPIFCSTDISIEYRFHKGGLTHLYNHSVGVGLKYNFYL